MIVGTVERQPSQEIEVGTAFPPEISELAARVNRMAVGEEGFSAKIRASCQAFENKVRKYGLILALQDSGQAFLRSILSIIKEASKDKPDVVDVTDTVNRVSTIVAGFFGMITKGIETKEAILKFKAVWRYGDLYDRLDGLITLLRTFVNLMKVTSESIKASIFSVTVDILMKLPIFVLKCISNLIWIVRALYRIIRMGIAHYKLSHLTGTDRDKLLQAIALFANAKERLRVYEEQVKAKHGDTPDVQKFLKERRELRLSQEFGSQAYKVIFAELDGKTVFEALEEDLDLPGDQTALIDTGLQWIQEVKAQMRTHIGDTIPILIGAILGLASTIFTLTVVPYASTIAASIGALSVVSWACASLVAYLRSRVVSANQKAWVKNMIQHHLVKEMHLDRGIKQRMHVLDAQINFSLIKHLKKYEKLMESKEISLKLYTKLHREMSKLYEALSLGDTPVAPLLGRMAQERVRLQGLSRDFSLSFFKVHKRLHAPG